MILGSVGNVHGGGNVGMVRRQALPRQHSGRIAGQLDVPFENYPDDLDDPDDNSLER